MKLMSWMIIALCCVLAFAPVSAQQRDRGGGWRGGGDRGRAVHHYYHERRPGYRYEQGRGWYDPSRIIGGAIGSFLWRQWAQPEPEPVRDVAWCMNRYRSYDPSTRTYLSYSGQYVACP